EWRGEIDPGSDERWAQWFDSYQEFIVEYAQLAAEIEADAFVVGVELVSSTRRDPDRWRQIIAAVREVYSGPITYAANWDEAIYVTFWDALDFIGVQMFAPLSDHPNPTYEELLVGANSHLATYRRLSETYGLPVILTEVGYKSTVGTTVSPYVWPEHLPAQGTVVSEEAQAAAYCAIIETFGQADFVSAMYWWKWFTDPDTREEGPTGFSPRGKLAEEVLRGAF
ncbi:MAG: hypothetical protein KC561_02065, partial [Myxococcales bacterium]|nr:hypothetical protein [Myxococcales bacterium]